MPNRVKWESLPFDEAIKFFKHKIDIPTEHWNDLWRVQHINAFSVAGATKMDLIQDLRGEIDKAIIDGTTLKTFQDEFDEIVKDHGWSYHGERGWRTSIMLFTNISTAYHAGHWKQMTDPDVLAKRPYLRYVESSSSRPRPIHVGWYNTILKADDPWWLTHYPPNGWGCK